MIHLYKDAALTQKISEGDMTAPDDDIYNGTDGESKDRELFVANEQTTLAAGVLIAATTLQVAEPRFSNFEIIIVDNEQMRVQGGGGTTTLTVVRAVSGSTAASHTAGSKVYSAANYNSLSVEVLDTSGSSETGWVRLSKTQTGLDTAVPGSSLAIGAKNWNVTTSFWRRITVPAGSAIENKIDLKIRIAGWENAV